jgi:hypothetical protein
MSVGVQPRGGAEKIDENSDAYAKERPPKHKEKRPKRISALIASVHNMFEEMGESPENMMQEHSTELTDTRGEEIQKAGVETSAPWTDYWIAYEILHPPFVVPLRFLLLVLTYQRDDSTTNKLPEIDRLAYAQGVGAVTRDYEEEDVLDSESC